MYRFYISVSKGLDRCVVLSFSVTASTLLVAFRLGVQGP